MRVSARCFAILRELAGDRLTLDLPDGARLADAWTAAAAGHPGLEPHRPHVRAARNGELTSWDEPLADGDEVAFLPPVSGGAAQPRVGLSERAIDVEALERLVAGPGHGAVLTFVGRARDRADDGREVVALEYEAYAEMAERVLADIAAEAEASAPGACVGVVHRVGRVQIGEAAVAIVVGAPHRVEAYVASRRVIEAIKERLPVWKLERFVDGTEWKRSGA
jgi:molybdopterin synthase catalytic subunit/molybdopterin converting factor small subunit